MKKGILIVISGPSGVGKGTVISEFINDPELNLMYSISMTTRNIRKGEVDGVNYHFVDKERFLQAIDNDEFLEWAEFVGNYYGTPTKSVNDALNQGKNVILEIEVDGTNQVKTKCPDALTIFITAPSLDELRKRIENRSSETVDVIQRRLDKARKELEFLHQYKYVVCNEDPILAADIIKLIIKRTVELKNNK